MQIAEILPNEFNPHQFNLKEALHLLHQPPPDISLDALEKGQHPAQQRLIFEELLAHNLAMQKVRLGTQQFSALPLRYQTDLKQRF
ncbi:ATP-dependent DNA helicase RecG [Rodentibacter pneumotropicus]|nr:ATP-dependent DNA helicase RecG [Rodentibacter pneumotropicus]